VGEGDRIPETPAQAMKHPDIMVFQRVCGRIPGARDYQGVIETMRFFRERVGDDDEQLVNYLTPYWLAWSTRKTKNQKPYSQASLVWYSEWAVNGDIPRANGHEPVPGESTSDVIRKVAQSAKR